MRRGLSSNCERRAEKRVPCYLEGSQAKLKEDLDVVHGFVGRLHQVDKHHVVYPKQGDQQEGGLGQTSGVVRDMEKAVADAQLYWRMSVNCSRR